MDTVTVSLMEKLVAALGGDCCQSQPPCQTDCNTQAAAMGRYNADLSALAVDSMRQFQKDMNDRDTIRQKLIAQTVLKPGT